MKEILLRELARVFLHEADTKSNDEATRLTDIAETLYVRANVRAVRAARRGNRQHWTHADRSARRRPHDEDRCFRGQRPTAKDGAR
jgi:hypothetical protein